MASHSPISFTCSFTKPKVEQLMASDSNQWKYINHHTIHKTNTDEREKKKQRRNKVAISKTKCQMYKKNKPIKSHNVWLRRYVLCVYISIFWSFLCVLLVFVWKIFDEKEIHMDLVTSNRTLRQFPLWLIVFVSIFSCLFMP